MSLESRIFVEKKCHCEDGFCGTSLEKVFFKGASESSACFRRNKCHFEGRFCGTSFQKACFKIDNRKSQLVDPEDGFRGIARQFHTKPFGVLCRVVGRVGRRFAFRPHPEQRALASRGPRQTKSKRLHASLGRPDLSDLDGLVQAGVVNAEQIHSLAHVRTGPDASGRVPLGASYLDGWCCGAKVYTVRRGASGRVWMRGAVMQRHTQSDFLRPDGSDLVRPDASDLARPDASVCPSVRTSIRPAVRPVEKIPF